MLRMCILQLPTVGYCLFFYFSCFGCFVGVAPGARTSSAQIHFRSIGSLRNVTSSPTKGIKVPCVATSTIVRSIQSDKRNEIWPLIFRVMSCHSDIWRAKFIPSGTWQTRQTERDICTANSGSRVEFHVEIFCSLGNKVMQDGFHEAL